MPSFNTAGRAYVGTIELDDIEIELEMSTIVSECDFNGLLTEMIDQSADSAITSIAETVCAEGKYPSLLNTLARVDPVVFNDCMNAASWIKTDNLSGLDNFLTTEIFDWLTEHRPTQLAEWMKARAPQRLSELERTAIALVTNFMHHRVTVAKNEMQQLEYLTVHTDLLNEMLIETVTFEEHK